MRYMISAICSMMVNQEQSWTFVLAITVAVLKSLLLVNGALIPSGSKILGQSGSYRVNMPPIYVLENTTIGSVIIQDIRTHLGLATNSLVKLGPGSLTQFFQLDSKSGRLVTIATLDLESPAICRAEKSCCRQETANSGSSFPIDKLPYTDPSFSVNGLGLNEVGREYSIADTCRMMAFILSQSGAENQLSPITRLYVTVVDLNDNAPVFRLTDDSSQTSTENKLSHGSGVNTQINDIPKIRVSFSEGPIGLQTRHDLPTAYDPDFSLTNRVKRYWLEWIRDGDKSPSSSNDPQIHGAIPNVLNLDDQNGLTWANLGPFRLIYLEPGRSIALELDTELDREQQDAYQLRLVAEDSGGLRGHMRIDVDVLDVNEYAPIFSDDPPSKEHLLQPHKPPGIYRKRYSVKESLSPGSQLGQLQAYDADQSPGGGITYRLGPGNPPAEIANTFHIHPRTGVLQLIGTLDYEKTPHYRLTVIAQDGPTTETGLPGPRSASSRTHLGTHKSATAIVEINVIDVNDNSPVIRFEKEDGMMIDSSRPTGAPGKLTTDVSKSPYEVWIKEDIPKGSPVTFFTVSDRDLGENGQVSCNLINRTEHFRLHEFTGLYGLETLDTFDREQLDKYYIIIRCHDHGVPVLQTDRALLIHIEDVNDLPPVFELPVYQFHVQENSPPGTPVKPISANFPSHVIATDPDLNSTIKYYLESRSTNQQSSQTVEVRLNGPGGMDHQLFHIDPVTGLVTTQGELDREDRARLSFQACADDGRHVTCTDVIVLLDDVNDNRPQFDRDTYVIRVEENQLSHKPILTFRVTDADAGNHGFFYDFWEEPSSVSESKRHTTDTNHTLLTPHEWENYEPGTVRYHFALRENTLYVRRPLDREIRSNYHFFVTVTDSQETPRIPFHGTNPTRSYQANLTSKAEIFIDVGDVNDNVPMFIFPNSTGPSGNRLSISCHETMGSSVGRLLATDPDLGQNATVVFSLIHTPELDSLFYLDGQSGELFVNTGQLTSKCGESLIMVVSVDDQGPAESKHSRPSPVERMLIKIEDKPTLAELIATEAKQQWRALSETNADASAGKNTVGSLENSFTYGALSTRTILSVVLGGSTVFLIGLLIVWMVLLLYNRSRRRKHVRASESRRFTNTPHIDPGSPLSALSGESPEKGTLFGGSLNSNKTENPYSEQFVRNLVQNDKTDSVTVHPTAIPINMDYYRCVADSELNFLPNKDGATFGKYTMRLAPSPTISSTPTPVTVPECSDYTTRLWHPEHELYHTCVSEQCRMRGLTPATVHNTMRRSPGGLELATISRAPKESSTFGRLLPRWLLNNIAPRHQANKEDCAMGEEIRTVREKKPNTTASKSMSIGHRPMSTLPIYDHHLSSTHHGRSVRTMENPIASRSSPGCSTHPDPSTVGYTSLRRYTPIGPSDRLLNNHTDRKQLSRTSHPFLTPPAIRRCDESFGDTSDRSAQQATGSCINKEDYTSLLRPGMECELRDCPARPSSSIPMLNIIEHPQFDAIRTSAANIQSGTTGRRMVTTPKGKLSCHAPTSYPCCSACEPMVHEGNSSLLLNGCELISQGDGQHSTTDSIQNCPQCRMMGVTVLSSTCCPDSCSLLQPVSSRPGTGVDDLNAVDTTTDPSMTDQQCTAAYMSVQEMLNSCV